MSEHTWRELERADMDTAAAHSFDEERRAAMTDNRTTLLPCPFCGGEAHTYKNNLWHVACERAHNGCVTMSAFVTEAEAIAAWNSRYHSEFEKTVIKAWKEIKDYTERTCKNDDDDCDAWFKCSECGLHSKLEIMSGGYGIPNYCPNCGARVRSE